jgi:hypothetical protein
MKCANLAASAVLVFFLAACEDEAKYPVTGEECGPDDPVRTLDASDCASAAPLATGF